MRSSDCKKIMKTEQKKERKELELKGHNVYACLWMWVWEKERVKVVWLNRCSKGSRCASDPIFIVIALLSHWLITAQSEITITKPSLCFYWLALFWLAEQSNHLLRERGYQEQVSWVTALDFLCRQEVRAFMRAMDWFPRTAGLGKEKAASCWEESWTAVVGLAVCVCVCVCVCENKLLYVVLCNKQEWSRSCATLIERWRKRGSIPPH